MLKIYCIAGKAQNASNASSKKGGGRACSNNQSDARRKEGQVERGEKENGCPTHTAKEAAY
jgi:hypothetical protein